MPDRRHTPKFIIRPIFKMAAYQVSSQLAFCSRDSACKIQLSNSVHTNLREDVLMTYTLSLKLTFFRHQSQVKLCHTRILQKVLSLGLNYFSVKFYQTYFYYRPSKYFPLQKHIFVSFLSSHEKQINSLILVSVGDTD